MEPFMQGGEVIQIMGPRQARMQSRRTEGVWYAVDADARGGSGSCSCKGFEVRKRCRHLTAWKSFLATGSAPAGDSDIDEAFPVTKEETGC